MGFLLDITVLASLAAALVIGYKKGFALTMIKSCSYLISVILTGCFYKAAASYITASKFGVFLTGKVEVILLKSMAKKADTLISDLALPEVLKKGIAGGEFFQNVVTTLAHNITNAVITVITVILLFVLLRFLLKVLKKPIKALASLPIIKHIDKFLGGAVGIIAGLFWVYAAMALIGAFSFVPIIDYVAKFILESDFARLFYDNNILLYMIM